MNKALRRLHLIAYFTAILFYFLLGYPFLLFYARNPTKYYNQLVKMRRWISLAGFYTVGFRIKIEYEQAIDWNRNYIICPNHTSILDITVINNLCPSSFSFMGKIELLKNPVTRIFFKTIDIAVKRDSKVSSFKAYKNGSALVQQGKSLVIFPEGKIDDQYPPTLHRFKSGAFRIATENNIALLPVVIQDAWKVLWDDGLKSGSKPGTIHVKVLAPIQTNGLDTAAIDFLETDVYNKMKDAWDIYNKS
ncbi:lysophospholipid acyltransferase family protein [Sphingobacterium wenxiniae]|uniref:1-acyl-sn-glycerol-3-phosphate acyltransferase n=1 Tax=Sphingobacterium wenxiniae TaxID=683125 RepID=A0A1I6VJ39_9SPHI|nr:lysophospholipid acyltransferase family protein [Sphingobacterium wenxiniae]SFT13464.1 1-acyl-sn-glycerol-3-phosphate acyltransferase [Sphingobacterium wenxiniae]